MVNPANLIEEPEKLRQIPDLQWGLQSWRFENPIRGRATF